MKPDDDEPALRRQAAHALIEALATDGIEDGVDPLAVVLRAERRDPVALGVEDAVGAGALGDVHLVGSGGDGDHLGAEATGDLYRGGADATAPPRGSRPARRARTRPRRARAKCAVW